MMLRRIGLLLIAGTCVWPTAPVRPQSPQTRFRADVEVVRLDVSVLDRDRRPVRGLKAADFVVLEDGRPRPIVAFSSVDVSDAGEPAEGWLREVASDIASNQLDLQRIVVIVMDDGMTEGDPLTAKTARQIARQVIDRLGPDDLAAVVFTFQGRSQNFTRDRRLLTAAADSFVPKSPVLPGTFSAASNPTQGIGPPLGCAIPGRPNCLIRTLKSVATALEDTPVGRKSIVLVSSGVPGTLEAGEAVDDLQDALRSLQLANVNVYPFDPAGLTAAGLMSPRLDWLQAVAESTGGRATIATNAPWVEVPQVFVENGSYYLLGIEPDRRREGGRFRRIVVRVGRPDVEVRTRAGYYPPRAVRRRPDGSSARTGSLDQAFGAALPSGALPLSVAVAPFALPDRRQAAVAVTVCVRRPVTGSVAVETLEVRAAAFDEQYRQRDAQRQTLEVTLRPNAIGERWVEFQSRLTLRPGRYEVRVAAAAPNAAGGVFLPVDVPDFRKSRLSLSGLVLGRSRAGASDILADLVPLLPTATREISPRDTIAAFLRVYQGAQDEPRPVHVSARILDATLRQVFGETLDLQADLFGSSRAADYHLELPLAHLGAGQYLLTVEVADAKATASREVRFVVGGR